MKKTLFSILTFASSVLFINAASAQAFETAVADTLRLTISDHIDAYNEITNKSSAPLKVDWKVVSHNFPTSWGDPARLGMCDNSLCRQNTGNQLLNGQQTFTSLDYAPNVKGDWHIQMIGYGDPSVDAGTYYVTVNYKENGGLYNKDVTFVFTKFPTNVGNVSKAGDRIVIYPNPASDEINVSLENENVKKIAIYNLLGNKVSDYRVSGNNVSTVKLNIANIPTGVYFMRFSNASGNIIATRKFTHQ